LGPGNAAAANAGICSHDTGTCIIAALISSLALMSLLLVDIWLDLNAFGARFFDLCRDRKIRS
jgi:hypothetical protein